MSSPRAPYEPKPFKTLQSARNPEVDFPELVGLAADEASDTAVTGLRETSGAPTPAPSPVTAPAPVEPARALELTEPLPNAGLALLEEQALDETTQQPAPPAEPSVTRTSPAAASIPDIEDPSPAVPSPPIAAPLANAEVAAPAGHGQHAEPHSPSPTQRMQASLVMPITPATKSAPPPKELAKQLETVRPESAISLEPVPSEAAGRARLQRARAFADAVPDAERPTDLASP